MSFSKLLLVAGLAASALTLQAAPPAAADPSSKSLQILQRRLHGIEVVSREARTQDVALADEAAKLTAELEQENQGQKRPEILAAIRLQLKSVETRRQTLADTLKTVAKQDGYLREQIHRLQRDATSPEGTAAKPTTP